MIRPVDERVSSPSEAYRALGDSVSNDIRVSMPGIIKSFDPKTQTAVINISIRERIVDKNGKEQDEEIPELQDVPVFFPGGLDFDICFPVLPDMECLVIFGDSCMDAWWESGGIQNQTEIRRHDLSDGFALVGFRSQTNLAKKYKDDAIIISAKNTLIEIKQEEILLDSIDKINIKSKNLINLSSSKISLTASNINIDGELVINGENYKDHKHVGVEPGSGITGVKA